MFMRKTQSVNRQICTDPVYLLDLEKNNVRKLRNRLYYVRGF